MSQPEIVPRQSMVGVIVVWAIAAVTAITIGAVAPPDWRAAWMAVGMGLILGVAFAVQLWSGRSQGFLQRMAMSVLGALFIMGFIGIGLGLATLFSA